MGAKREKRSGEYTGDRRRKVKDGENIRGSMNKEKKVEPVLPSTIKNKDRRLAVHAKAKQEKRLEKRKRAKAREAEEKRALELGEEVFLFI